jgi:iron(III) transport system permease protein
LTSWRPGPAVVLPASPLGGTAGVGATRRSAAGRARRPRPPWPLALPALAIAAAVNLPLVYLAVRAGERGWQRYWDAVAAPGTLALVGRTLGLAAGAVALAVVVAVPLAWLVVRTDLPGRRFWGVAAALPLVFPSYVSAFALVAVLGPRGALQGWLAPLGVERLPELVYGYGGAVAALGLFTYPYVYLLAAAALARVDPALEESSVSLGHGRWRTFFRVVLPQLAPAIYGGGLLVALYALADFGAVTILRFPTFTVAIYNAYRGLFDRTEAAALGTVLVALTFVLLAVEALAARRLRPPPPRPSRPAPRLALGRWRTAAVAAVAAVALVTLALPLGVIVSWAVRAVASGGLGDVAAVAATAAASLGVAVAAAVVATAAAVPVAAWAWRQAGALPRATERLASSGYALPGLVIALALVFFATRWARPLYQTLALLVFAYVVRFLPEALAAVRTALAAVPPRLEEAGRSLGRGPAAVLASVTLPLLRPGLAAGAGLVFLTTLKELPATLILRPIGFDTLAVEVWSAAAEGIYSQAALPALALVAVSSLPVYWLVVRPALAERGAAPGGGR